jgi:hypothetical protein
VLKPSISEVPHSNTLPVENIPIPVRESLSAIPIPVTVSAVQEMTVSGKVTSDTGEELPGVNVLLKGTNMGTISDIEGKYTLRVPEENSTLVFSFIGYITQEIEVNSRSVINVQLASDTKQLSEVVVTTLGIERQEKALGYSAPRLDGAQISNVKESNVINLLAGKVAGVNIRKTSPDPGATSLITIRGQSSLTGDKQPLFVVDGVPIANGLNNLSQKVGKEWWIMAILPLTLIRMILPALRY